MIASSTRGFATPRAATPTVTNPYPRPPDQDEKGSLCARRRRDRNGRLPIARSAVEEDQISSTPGISWLPCWRGIRSRSSREGRMPARSKRRSPPGSPEAVGSGGEYSTEVPQQIRIQTDADTRSGTVTCGYGRGWTCCLLFASRGSGVRVPLAPLVRDTIRTAGAESTAAKYRNRGRGRCRASVRAGLRPRGRLRPGMYRSHVLGRDPGN